MIPFDVAKKKKLVNMADHTGTDVRIWDHGTGALEFWPTDGSQINSIFYYKLIAGSRVPRILIFLSFTSLTKLGFKSFICY